MYHLQVKRRDGTLVAAPAISEKQTPKLQERVQCPQHNGQPIHGKVSAIVTNTILSDDGRPLDLVEAVEI